jgi:hypothetical protein
VAQLRERLAVAGFVLAGLRCANGLEQVHAAPPVAAYETPIQFTGEWLGEFGEITGMLAIKALDEGRYYGLFDGESEPVQYVLNMEQSPTETDAGATFGNRVLFTWQDGRGGRGQGWVLINREDTALTGEFGFAESVAGAGSLAFIRVQ